MSDQRIKIENAIACAFGIGWNVQHDGVIKSSQLYIDKRNDCIHRYADEIESLIRSAAPSSALVDAARQLDSQLPVEPTFSLVDGLVTEWNCKCCAAVLKAEYIPDPSNKIFRVRLTNGPDQMQHKPDCDWMAFRASLEGQGTKVCRCKYPGDTYGKLVEWEVCSCCHRPRVDPLPGILELLNPIEVKEGE